MKNFNYRHIAAQLTATIITGCICSYSTAQNAKSHSSFKESEDTLTAAVISARKESGIKGTGMSAISIPVDMIASMPSLFGEADVLKAVQLMPGVQAGNTGFSGIYVRGGGNDENLLLLDGIPLYNAEHLLGLFSVFQPEAVRKVTLYKGSFPARYGGRISSIVDIRTKNGDMEAVHGSASIGAISDKFHIEGPLAKGKTSFSLSARGMHTVLLEPLLRTQSTSGNYYFFDINGKLTHRFSNKDRLSISSYYGRDLAYFNEKYSENDGNYSYDDRSGIRWGNFLYSIHWNHVCSDRLSYNVSAAVTDYKMVMEYSSRDRSQSQSNGTVSKSGFDFKYSSGIKDASAMLDFDYTPDSVHTVKFGVNYVFHTFVPQTYSTRETEKENSTIVSDTTGSSTGRILRGNELACYIEDEFRVGRLLSLNPGIRLVTFIVPGRACLSAEPRLSAKIEFPGCLSIKAAYSRMAQYVHLLSPDIITLPLDLWVPVTKKIKPITAEQYSLGIYSDRLRGWEISVEGYLKNTRNVLEYKDGTNFSGRVQDWESLVAPGKSMAAGIELLVQKTAGKTKGWLGYTLAKNEKIFQGGEVNSGKKFPGKYDRRHAISAVVNHTFSQRADLSATWVFATGGTATLPESSIVLEKPDGEMIQADYAPHKNNYRLPPNHLLNLAVNIHKQRRHGRRTWTLGVYNVYNRMNPDFVFMKNTEDRIEDSELYAKKTTLRSITILPLIPYASYSFQF